jgi:outer membrane protein assembly factor BamB
VLLLAGLAALALPGPASAQLPVPLPGLGDDPPPGQPPPEEQPKPRPQPPRQGPAPAAGEVGVYRGNAARDGVTPDDAVFGPLGRLWTKRMPGYVNHPLLIGGKVIANVSRSDGTGYGSDVIAWDVRTGRELWRAPTPGVYFSAHIASDGQRVFSVNHDGLMRAFAVGDGRRLWERGLDAERKRVDEPPIVAGGLVISEVHDASAGDDLMIALDPATGAEVWREAAPAYYDGKLLADRERAYRVGNCGEVTAVRLGDGERAWSFARNEGSCLDHPLIGVVHEGRLYGYGGVVRDAASGREVGRLPAPAEPAIAGGLAVFNSDGATQAMALGGGGVRWTARVKGSAFGVDPLAPAIVGPTVYAVGPNGRLLGLARETGALLSSTSLANETASSVGGIKGGIAAGQGVLAVTQNRALSVYTGVLRPAPGGTDIAASRYDLVYGQRTSLAAAVGTRLAGRRVRLQEDRFPYGRWRTVRSGPTLPDRTFYAGGRVTRNTRFRLVAPGARPTPRLTVTSVPKLASSVRAIGPRTIEVRAKLRGPRDLPAAGRRLYVYLGRVRQDRVERLGSGRLRRTGRGRASTRVRFRAPRRVGSRDVVLFCVKGLAARGFGVRDAFERGCGRGRMRIRL